MEKPTHIEATEAIIKLTLNEENELSKDELYEEIKSRMALALDLTNEQYEEAIQYVCERINY